MGYFNLKSGIIVYGANARHNVQHLSAEIANMVCGHSRSSTSFIETRGSHFFSGIFVIRHFGAVWAWPDCHGCTGDTLCLVVGIVAG